MISIMNSSKSSAVRELVEMKKKNNDWMANMTFDEKGNISKSIDNIITFLTEHPMFKGKIMYNDYLKRKEIDGEEFTDFDLNNIYVNVERCLGFDSRSKCDSAISEVFNNNRYNPVINYLDGLIWDKEKRIETVFNKLFDVEDTKLNREIAKKWFVAAIKRVMEPGCKFDNIIVLQGGQGIGKSTFCEKISNGFYSQLSIDELINPKDVVDKLNKTWIAIIDELDGFGSKDMKKIKSFLSESAQTVRLSYERNSQTFKRHCVFIGSTNDDTFLRDNTSSVERRFWVLKCRKTQMDTMVGDYLTKYMIDQLWAEAMYYYETESMYLDIDKSLFKEFEDKQSQFKTFQTDESTEWANDILNRQYNIYDSGCFNDANEFFNQVRGIYDYSTTQKCKIDKIPGSWLCQILKREYSIRISEKTLAMAIDKEWEFKVIKYNGASVRGFVRRGKNNGGKNEKSGENSGISQGDLPF